MKTAAPENDLDLLLDDARAHHRAGRLDVASNAYSEILHVEPDRADVAHLLGNVEYQRAHFDVAIALFERAIALDDTSSVYRIALGHALRRVGRLSDAEACYRAALSLRPDSALAAMGWTKVLVEREQFDQAADLLQRVLRQEPGHLEALLSLGKVYLQLERPADALQLLCGSLALHAQDADIRFNLGVAASQLGDLDAASECFTMALQLRPDFAEACYNLGTIDSDRGELASAEAWLRRALGLKPDYVDAEINLSAVLLKGGQSEEAKLHRDRAYRQQCVFVRPSRAARRTVLVLFDAGKGNMNLSHLFSRRHNTLVDWMIEYAPRDQSLPPFDLVFNAMGDPAMTGKTAAPVESFLNTCSKPVLNRPDAVARTARDRIPGLLADIEGLHVPATRLMKSAELATFGAEQLPVLVRPLDSHGGAGLQLIERVDELEDARHTTAGALYLTPFRDFRSADGYFRKYRIIFIDRKPLPYHLAISADWLVHYATADMNAKWKLDEERRFLENPAAVLGAGAYAAIESIGERLDLDYAGMDFSMLADGRVLLFEANPVMLVHPEPAGSATAHKNVYVSRIFDAFEALLAERCSGERTSS